MSKFTQKHYTTILDTMQSVAHSNGMDIGKGCIGKKNLYMDMLTAFKTVFKDDNDKFDIDKWHNYISQGRNN